MAYKELFLSLLVVTYVNAQYKVCVLRSDTSTCQNLDKDGSEVECVGVETRLDCAIKLARGEANFGAFSEEELLVLGQMQLPDVQVVATIRSTEKQDVQYAFEAVTVVPNNHSGGLEGLRGGRYCHPGLDSPDLRWSPRVLKALELSAARSDRCPGATTDFKTAEELEVEELSKFFSAACRPGPWSYNTTVDADLKSRYSSLCSMCEDGRCTGYSTASVVNVAGVNNNNRHIQALDCLVTNGTVAFAAWQHVQEFFLKRNPQHVDAYSLLCPNGSLQPLSIDVLGQVVSPCATVRQPWRAIVASSLTASEINSKLNIWWTDGTDPGSGSWQSALYQSLVGGSNFRVVGESLTTPLNYSSQIRPLDIATSAACLTPRRWCTISALETTKCQWTAAAAYTLGIQPTISCERRNGVFDCLNDIKEGKADFSSVDSHYGFLARQHYRLSPVKLVQNTRTSASRVAAFVKETSAQANITRFENLRDKVACFPEFGGIAYVSFVRAAHERQVVSPSECDYARAVGEFFSGACAPGATDAAHTVYEDSSFNASSLCSACRSSSSANSSISEYTCAWDNTNLYFGNNGSLLCLADPATDVVFVETENIAAQLSALQLNPNNYRALCRNNTLAASTGVNIDDGCLLAYVVDAEVLTRRNDPVANSVNTLFDTLDKFFGYNPNTQLINLRLYSPFDSTSDLLFKDTTIGITEPSSTANHEPARNYIELFRHLESCTGAATPLPAPGLAVRTVFSIVTLLISLFMSRAIF
ncbi:transferrin-like [Galleria mellonella]|uniref:Transferrin-like n=1 Tax=Galleria mellonella TaxID=7137 RepID=A0A6J1W917_GALME|nr:transferrin-like [Galleria mellonella]